MKKKFAIIICGIVLSGLSISAVTKVSQPVNYDYVILAYESLDKELTITYGSERFEKIDLKKQVEHKNDFRPTFKKVSEFQNNGWELVQTNHSHANGFPAIFIMLQKAK